MIDTSTASTQKEKVEIITRHLETEMKNLFESERYRDFLKTVARFPRYSANNCLLIFSQNPSASYVCSFTAWREMGRYPKRGEKGLCILCPVPHLKTVEKAVTDSNGKPITDTDGTQKTEKEQVEIVNFRIGYVFDVSQTEGKEIELLKPKILTGDVENAEAIKEALIKAAACPVSFSQIPGSVNGYYDPAKKEIVVDSDLPSLHQIKTLIHEIAHKTVDSHALLGKYDRAENEVIAESTAFICAESIGIDTRDYSLNYIGNWAQGRELSALKRTLSEIQSCALEITAVLDKELHLENIRHSEKVKQKARTA